MYQKSDKPKNKYKQSQSSYNNRNESSKQVNILYQKKPTNAPYRVKQSQQQTDKSLDGLPEDGQAYSNDEQTSVIHRDFQQTQLKQQNRKICYDSIVPFALQKQQLQYNKTEKSTTHNEQQEPQQNTNLKSQLLIKKKNQPRLLYDQMGALFKILKYSKGRANITITFDDMHKDLPCLLEDNLTQWELDSLRFTYLNNDQNQTQEQTNITNASSINLLDQSNSSLIQSIKSYKFKKQQNEVEPSMKIVVILCLKLKALFNLRQNFNVQFLSMAIDDSLGFQLENMIILEKIFGSISKVLDSYTILVHECLDENEALAKQQGLSKLSNKFQQLIGKSISWDQKIYLTQDLRSSDLEQFNDNYLMDQLNMWQYKHILFILIEDPAQDRCQELQQMFDQFVSDPQNIYRKTKHFKVILERQISNFEDKVETIISVGKTNANAMIIVDEPTYSQNSWIVNVYVTYWISSDQSINKKIHKKLQEEVNEILNGQIRIKIKDSHHIILWDKLLGLLFGKMAKEKQIILKCQPFEISHKQQGLTIDIKSKQLDRDSEVADFAVELEESFENYQEDTLSIRVPDDQVCLLLQQISSAQMAQIFRTAYKLIYQQFQGQIFIENLECKPSTNTIQFKVYYHKNIHTTVIKNAIEEFLITRLDKVTSNINLKNFIGFTTYRSIYDLEISMELLVRSQGDFVTFVVYQDNLQRLQDAISMFKQDQKKQLVEYTYTFDNEYIAKHVVSKYEYIGFIVPPQLQEKKFLIRGEQKQIDNQVQQIDLMVEKFRKSIKELEIQMTLAESDFLQKYKVDDIQLLQTNFDCYIQIIPLQQDQKNHIIAQKQYPNWQWSWYDGKIFVDYQEHINKQIDQAYANAEFNIDKADFFSFQIGGVEYYMIFIDQSEATQMNVLTNFERKVQKVKFRHDPEPEPVQFQQKMVAYKIKGQTTQYLQNAKQSVQQLIKQNCSSLKMAIPLVDINVMNKLRENINDKITKIEGSVEAGKSVIITGITDNVLQIKSIIEMISQNQSIPNDWIDQEDNLTKVPLLSSSAEFEKVKINFRSSHRTGVIYQIYRIQNQHLHRNYIKEQNDLIERYRKDQNPLTQSETEQYLWHGVKQQHPKVIYEGVKEAFDVTYSNEGLWGAGVYFSTSALYSETYSYTLNKDDDHQYQGKKVFLCCKVTTGKSFDCPQNKTLRRPPFKHDSVTGVSTNTRVYVLYSMDVRRAYPAYEVIYQ